MAFLDDLKGRADEFKDRAMDLAQTGIAKSKQLAEIAKLRAANLSEEDNVRKAYLEIGKLYYAERGMAPEAPYAALCEKITACKVNIEENNARIDALRRDGGEETTTAEDADFSVEPEDVDSEEEMPAEPIVPPEVSETPAEPIVPKPETEVPETPAEPVVPPEPQVPVEPLADKKN